jgi:hypothetical protein
MVVVDRPNTLNRSNRPFEDRRQNTNGNAKIAEFEVRVPYLERCTPEQFERLLTRKFGPEYLQPIQLFKDGGGI